jgi:rRNA maturation endonuclease Nob1
MKPALNGHVDAKMISNNSRVDVYERCPREYYWSYVWDGAGLRPHRTATPLVDGIAIHEGLAELYRSNGLDAAHVALAESIKRDSSDLTLTAGQKLRVGDSVKWGQDLLTAYVNRDSTTADERAVVDDFAVQEVETQFQVVLGEICWSCGAPYPVTDEWFAQCTSCNASAHWWVGRADLVVMKNKKLRILDHKTAGSVGAAYLNSYAYNMQQTGYAYGIGKHNNTTITGYYINVLKKLQKVLPYDIQCTKCKGKGVVRKAEDLCKNCGGHGTVEKQPKQLFLRRYYPCGTDRKERFVHNRIILLNEIEQEATRWEIGEDKDECYPMHAKSCFTMRSKEGCPFIPLCWNNPESPTKWYNVNDARLSAYYERRSEDYVELIREEVR